MIKLLKITGLAFVCLTFFFIFGAMWGVTVERDNSLLKITVVCAAAGLGLLLWGILLEARKQKALGLSHNRISIGKQVLSGFIFIFQLFMVLMVLNFSIAIYFGIDSGEELSFKIFAYLFVSLLFLFLAWFTRRKILKVKQ